MRKPRDNTHLHRSAEQAVSDELPPVEAFEHALSTLRPTSAFVDGLFGRDGRLKPYTPPAKPEPIDPQNVDISKADTIDEALAMFPRESTKKTKVKALLMKGFSTFDITQKLRCSDGLVSTCRTELRRDFEAGIIASLPDEVLRARSLAKAGIPRPDISGANNPAVKLSQAGWRDAQHAGIGDVQAKRKARQSE